MFDINVPGQKVAQLHIPEPPFDETLRPVPRLLPRLHVALVHRRHSEVCYAGGSVGVMPPLLRGSAGILHI